MTSVELVIREQELEKEVTAITVLPFTVIEDNGNYLMAVSYAQTLKAKMAEIDEAYDDLINKAHEQHKATIAKKKKYWQPLKDAFNKIDRIMTAYTTKRERERREEERKLREAALKQQQEDMLKEAALLETQGDALGAECVLAEAMNAPAPVVIAQSQVPVVAGAYSRPMPWKFVIVDREKINDAYWIPDEAAIAAVVRAKGKQAEHLIGKGSIRCYQETKTIIKK